MLVLNYFYNKQKLEYTFQISFPPTSKVFQVIYNIHHQNVFPLLIVLQFEYSISLQQQSIIQIIISTHIIFKFQTFPASSNACLSYRKKKQQKISDDILLKYTLLANPVNKYVCKNPAIIINGIKAIVSNVNDQP